MDVTCALEREPEWRQDMVIRTWSGDVHSIAPSDRHDGGRKIAAWWLWLDDEDPLEAEMYLLTELARIMAASHERMGDN